MPRILIGNIKGPQGAQGIQGPQGPVGATGPQGPMPDLINNALATEAGVAALDAAMGKTLQDQLTELNSNIKPKVGNITNIYEGIDPNSVKISRSGNIAILNIAALIPAGTYRKGDVLMMLPWGSYNGVARGLVSRKNNVISILVVNADGTVVFNSDQTLAESEYVIGQVVYVIK